MESEGDYRSKPLEEIAWKSGNQKMASLY